VTLVVLFHAGLYGMRGGFIGVDIFFVISGYLISGIIIRSLRRGTFTLGQFYVRRINRIFPALVIVLFATLLVGWTFMYARELPQLGKHVLAGSTFSSNFVLWRENGYFDSPEKPLLHLWSLAVEEQFYLLWPATLLLVWKTKRDVRWTLIAVIEASFVVNIWQVRHSGGMAAFFLPASRFWEIMAGSLLFQIENSGDALAQQWEALRRRAPDALSVSGLGLIGLSVYLAKPSDLWPSWQGLIPVAGTVLIIAAGRDAWLNEKILGNRAIVAVGLISYPLYLWHWPLFVFTRLTFEGSPPWWAQISVIALSLGLATLTFRLVERRIRFGKQKVRSALILLPCLATTALLGAIVKQGIVGTRLEPAQAVTERRWGHAWMYPKGQHTDDKYGNQTFFTPGDSSNTVVMFGDSHLQQYWGRVEYLLPAIQAAHERVAVMAYPACPQLPGLNPRTPSWSGAPWTCDEFTREAFDYMKKPFVKTAVIAGYWENYTADKLIPAHAEGETATTPAKDYLNHSYSIFEHEIGMLTGSGKRVFLILPNPTTPSHLPGSRVPRRLAGLLSTETAPAILKGEFLAKTRAVSDRLRQIAQRTGAIVIDPTDFVCDTTTCPLITPEGEPMYLDDHHFRAGWASRHASFIDVIFIH